MIKKKLRIFYLCFCNTVLSFPSLFELSCNKWRHDDSNKLHHQALSWACLHASSADSLSSSIINKTPVSAPLARFCRVISLIWRLSFVRMFLPQFGAILLPSVNSHLCSSSPCPVHVLPYRIRSLPPPFCAAAVTLPCHGCCCSCCVTAPGSLHLHLSHR